MWKSILRLWQISSRGRDYFSSTFLLRLCDFAQLGCHQRLLSPITFEYSVISSHNRSHQVIKDQTSGVTQTQTCVIYEVKLEKVSTLKSWKVKSKTKHKKQNSDPTVKLGSLIT